MPPVLAWLLRRTRRQAADPLPGKAIAGRSGGPPSDVELIARADEYNRSAERYWRELAREPAGREHVLNKPFGTVTETPAALYRLGLVLAELHAGPGHAVLDFGAGSCWLSSCLNRQGVSTIAVDVSPSALEMGRELFSMDKRQRPEVESRFLPYDGHRLPLADESVDRVVCFDALHHVPNLDEVLAELARVLRRGGRAVLAEPGKGHAHSEASVFDVERFDVLENELSAPDLERRALRAGFTEVRLKPYADPSALSVSVEQYQRLMDGDSRAFPIAELSRSLKQVLIAVLSKGEEVFDSRFPHLLRAEIRREGGEGIVRWRGGTSLPVALQIRNTGDTVWRHELSALGGHVLVSGHLLGEGGRRLASGFFRVPLPRSVSPGDLLEMVADVLLPPLDLPRCRVRFDLVDERIAWFSQSGSETMDLDIELDAKAASVAPHGLCAKLVAALPHVGLSARPAEEISFSLHIENAGRSAWPCAPAPMPGTVSLGVHLLGAGGSMLDHDFLHLAVPHAVQPGGHCEMRCSFRAPLDPGQYRLKLDLVLETICWFETHGSDTLEVPLIVIGSAARA